MQYSNKYEAVIGLEVHAQLLTKSKLFSADDASFGADANTHISAITLAHPGTLPKLNKEAIELAVRMGLACNCEIEEINYFARKHYFYPDLPKGYQLTQHTTPVCKGGFVKIKTDAGERNIQLNRIHIEEDAGKSMHDQYPQYSTADYNRAGVPLIEIVSEPDMHTGEEAAAYVTELRKLVRALGVCDGNMEEGSMRCDANISIRPMGEIKLGTRVEVKNLNSIRNVKRAIDAEVERLIQITQNNETILQQTRSFDADKGTTFALRSKEEADDYRYFPEPDLPPFYISEKHIESIKAAMPMLPAALQQKYKEAYGLSEYDVSIICSDKDDAAYYEALITGNAHNKAAANWMLGPLKAYCNEHNISIAQFPLKPAQVAALIHFTESGKISFNIASTKILPAMITEGGGEPLSIATKMNLLQEADESTVEQWVKETLASMPQKVKEYKGGKKTLIGLFAGQVKKLSGGKAPMPLVNKFLEQHLNQ